MADCLSEKKKYWEKRLGTTRNKIKNAGKWPVGKNLYREITDHTCLKPDCRKGDIIGLCEEARNLRLGAVCVTPVWVDLCLEERRRIEGTFKIVSVIDFPLGGGRTQARYGAVLDVSRAGADEVDVVLPLGKMLSGQYEQVYEDLSLICSAGLYTKVILESSLIGRADTVDGAIIALLAGADCLKTSTGVNGKATEKDVRLLREIAGDEADVKAAGGIRTLEDVVKMTQAGANRLGMSASAGIFR